MRVFSGRLKCSVTEPLCKNCNKHDEFILFILYCTEHQFTVGRGICYLIVHVCRHFQLNFHLKRQQDLVEF
jgi:hypothetical protein